MMGVSTIVVLILIGFIIQLIDQFATSRFSFIPSRALIEPWRFVTSMFLHGGFFHLIINLYVLIQFGTLIEKRIGTNNFLILYFGSGVLGNLLFYLAAYYGLISMNSLGVGASGAIAGLLGASVIFFPYLQVLLFFAIPMPMAVFAVVYLIIELLGTFNMQYTGIGSAAHLGGFIFGLLYGFMFEENY
jgi:membrane associated rhomboid family serine protease